MKINCIIIENNSKHLNVLQRYCYENQDLNWMGSFANAIEAVDTINALKTVLVFCNVTLLMTEQVTFTKLLKNNPIFVFMATKSTQNIRIKGLKTIEYLPKPLTAKMVKNVTHRALGILDFSTLFETNIISTDGKSITSNKTIIVKYGHEAHQVTIDDITYIQGLQGTLRIHTANTPPVKTLMKITALEEKLGTAKFIRIHPGFLVNISRITAIQKKKVQLNNIYLPIEDSFKTSLLDRIGQFE